MKTNNFSLDNILTIIELKSELELEKAQSLIGQFGWMKKDDPSLIPLEQHLINLIEKYEAKHWSDVDSITDEQVKQSDVAELIVDLRNKFIQKRKDRIKKELKARGLKQKDLALLLARRETHLSEQLNGLRQFSRTDLRILNRLFHIQLKYLFDPFLDEDIRERVKDVISKFPDANLELKKEDLVLA